MVTEAPSAHRGGVAIFYLEAEHFVIKDLCLHGPNVISFQLVTGRRRWHVGGFYINPSDALTIEYITVAIGNRTYGDGLLVDVDLNANLAGLEGTPRDEVIADKLAAADIVDMGLHFLPRRKPWLQDRCTWIMRRDGI